MKIRRVKANNLNPIPSKIGVSSSDDNMLFNPSELKQMYHSGKRSKVIKITLRCLLVAAIGTAAYAGSIWYEQYHKTTVLKASIAAHKAALQELEQEAAAAKQEQCQSAGQKLTTEQQKLATDQASLSSDQEQYSSEQQALTSAEQQLSTDGPLLIPSTENLIQSTQNEISSTQSLITPMQELVNQDQGFISQEQSFVSQLGCH